MRVVFVTTILNSVSSIQMNWAVWSACNEKGLSFPACSSTSECLVGPGERWKDGRAGNGSNIRNSGLTQTFRSWGYGILVILVSTTEPVLVLIGKG